MTLGVSKSSDLNVIQCSRHTIEKKRKFDELMTENKVSINWQNDKQQLKRNYGIERLSDNTSLESPAKRPRISTIMSGIVSSTHAGGSHSIPINPILEQRDQNESKIQRIFSSLKAKFGFSKDIAPVLYNDRNSDELKDSIYNNSAQLRGSIDISDNSNKLGSNIDAERTKNILSDNKNDDQNNTLESQPNYHTIHTKRRIDEYSRHKSNKHNLKSITNIMSHNTSSRFASNMLLKFKKYRNNYPYRQEEKEKYRMLINSHLSCPNVGFANAVNSNKFHTQPVIDLTSSTNTSRRSSLQKDGLFVSSNVTNSLTNSGVHTEKLDNNSKSIIIERIRNKGIVAQIPQTNDKQSSTTSTHPFSPLLFNQSSRKYSPLYTSTPNSENLSSNSSDTSEAITKLPESSDAFKNLIKDKKNFLDDSFIADMRNSLKSTLDSNNRKILDGERKLTQCKIKRQTDGENLKSYIKTPYVRSELVPYIPFLPLELVKEEDEEVDELELLDTPEDEEILSKELPDLTPEMEQLIDDALRPSPPGQVLSEAFSITVKRRDMETLSGLNWLNDEIINFYMSLIVERSKLDNYASAYAFNTFFYPKLREGGHKVLKRWTRKVDVFSFNLIFIPVHLGMHWCLAVIDFTRKKIQYFDSMGGKNNECLNALKCYLMEESIDKKKKEFDMNDWSLEIVKDIPQQQNGSDCGMFTCKYAEYISRNSKLNFSQAHMPYFRRRMVYEILSKRLL